MRSSYRIDEMVWIACYYNVEISLMCQGRVQEKHRGQAATPDGMSVQARW